MHFSRWLTLLLSQEFPLPDVQRIWDSLLSDATRSNFLVDVCAAMVVLARGDILQNDFPENMKLLQVYYISGLRSTLSSRGAPVKYIFLESKKGVSRCTFSIRLSPGVNCESHLQYLISILLIMPQFIEHLFLFF